MPSPLVSAREAEADLREAGYEPLEPYPGRVILPWKVRCVTCGHEYAPSLNTLRKGQRCVHPVTPERAREELLSLGYEPLEDYPGTLKEPWRMRCVVCKKPRRTRLDYLKQNPQPCPCEAKRKAAESLLRAAGYEPLEPFPGTSRHPWRARCLDCGAERRPNLDTVKKGSRCKHEDAMLR